ncbi:MAG TPA: type VI secretion system baseplate subunit TssE [Longimicrobium sp.]|jgi:type VI secretion system lysozyme-like protein|uniref:type VI secretion system baseplate subunit TssE n=1 Tax=Longimicrobium sp. TaxID=2029185 RepID=UPI002ED773E2
MTAPRSAPVAPAPLFDRLEDPGPGAPGPPRALNGDELRWSVRRELTDLLNTRCPVPPAALEGRARTTLEYGLSRAPVTYPGSAAARAELEAGMRAAIAAYEPRLRVTDLVVQPVEGRPSELLARIRAVLVAGAEPVPAEFTIRVGCPGGRTP